MRAHAALALCCALAGLLPGAAAAGTVYKTMGPDGRVVYTDQAPADGKAQKTLRFDDLPSSPVPPEILRLRAELEKSARQRVEQVNAAAGLDNVIFTAAWCGYCQQAKAYLAARRVAVREIDIDTPAGRQTFVQASGRGGIPLLLWGASRVQGFSVPAYDQVLAGR